jgi:hypothetical protein
MSYVICLKNNDYPAALEAHKLYEKVPDEKSEGMGLVRVIDESGEDYLYPREMFAAIELPADIELALKPA